MAVLHVLHRDVGFQPLTIVSRVARKIFSDDHSSTNFGFKILKSSEFKGSPGFLNIFAQRMQLQLHESRSGEEETARMATRYC